MNATILYKFTNEETGVEGRVVKLNDGRFSATLFDLDAQSYVGIAFIHADESLVVAKAKKFAN